MWRNLRLRLTRFALETEIVWRYLFNLTPTLAYRHDPPVLGEEAQHVLQELNRDGVAVTSVDRLCRDTGLYDRLLETVLDRVRTQDGAPSKGLNGAEGHAYTFETNYLGAQPRFEPESIFARFAVQQDILSVVNAYFGMYTQLRKYAVFRNEVSRDAPTVNQRFHRDGDFHYLILRLFVYLADVDEGCGPFTYYPGTHVKGSISRKATLEEVAAVIQPRPIVGPARTIVFADTRGFHRGGRCETGYRFFYNALYTSPAVGADYFERPATGKVRRSDPQSWALSPPRLFL